MKQFVPAVHTPEAFGEELSQMHRSAPDLFVHGSIGRAVLFAGAYGNPNYEFSLRDQDPLHNGKLSRDLDVGGLAVDTVKTYQPFEVEADGFANPFLELTKDGSEWFLCASGHDFAEALHPDIMTPVTGITVFDAPTTTLLAQTHLALFLAKDTRRPKDDQTKVLLEQVIEATHSTPFTPKMKEPFEKLGALNRRHWYVQTQAAYRKYVPNSIRTHLVPTMRVAKRVLL